MFKSPQYLHRMRLLLNAREMLMLTFLTSRTRLRESTCRKAPRAEVLPVRSAVTPSNTAWKSPPPDAGMMSRTPELVYLASIFSLGIMMRALKGSPPLAPSFRDSTLQLLAPKASMFFSVILQPCGPSVSCSDSESILKGSTGGNCGRKKKQKQLEKSRDKCATTIGNRPSTINHRQSGETDNFRTRVAAATSHHNRRHYARPVSLAPLPQCCHSSCRLPRASCRLPLVAGAICDFCFASYATATATRFRNTSANSLTRFRLKTEGLPTSISGMPLARYGLKCSRAPMKQSTSLGSSRAHCLIYAAVKYKQNIKTIFDHLVKSTTINKNSE